MLVMGAVNERHEANRHNAAGHLVRWIVENGFTIDQVRGWTDGQWLHAAVSVPLATPVRTGRPPHPDTRKIVLGLLEGHSRRLRVVRD